MDKFDSNVIWYGWEALSKSKKIDASKNATQVFRIVSNNLSTLYGGCN